jgi:hypothetical protein
VTTKGLAVPVAVWLVAPDAAHVAVKLVAVPPLVDCVKATVICEVPAVTELMVGAPGTVIADGVTDTVPEATLLPLAFFAVTLQL